ncbi:fimbrial biogenesis outer membrane usher protein [Photobacterium damselae]|nr:fimbrial biogenesis outer membrane usher protein [Photobacterium damselae]
MIKKIFIFSVMITLSHHSYSEINPLFIHGGDFDAKGINEYINGKSFPPGEYVFPVYVNGEYYGKTKVSIDKKGNICKDITGLRFFYNTKVQKGMDCGEFDKATNSEFEISKDKNAIIYKVADKFMVERYDAEFLKREIDDVSVNSLFVNYSVQYSHNEYAGSNYYTNMNVNGNLSDFRLVSDFNINDDDIDIVELYGAKPLYGLNGEVKFGEFNTLIEPAFSNSLFIQGVSFNTDRDLYLKEKRHYPYKGFVSEPSDIFIYQGDRLIKRFFVDGGEYTLDSALASFQVSGDLRIVEKGISGSERVENVYLPSLENLLLDGEDFLSLSYGLIPDHDRSLYSLIYKYGFNYFTPFVSALSIDSDYQNYSLGASIYTGGDSELVLSLAHSSVDGMDGNSYGIAFRTYIPAFSINLDMSSFRYYEESYLSVGDYLNSIDSDYANPLKSRTDIGLSVALDNWYVSSAYARYSNSNYRKANGFVLDESNTLSLGLQGSASVPYDHDAYWSLSAAVDFENNEEMILASLTIPFHETKNSSLDIDSINFSLEKPMQSSEVNAVSTVRGGDTDLNYYLKLSTESDNNQFGIGAELFDVTRVNADISKSYKNIRAAGSLAITKEAGITLQSRNLTNPILIEAKGFENTRQQGVTLNKDGIGITESNGIPYNKQTWKLDASQAKSNTLVLSDKASHHLPKGVMTKVKFDTLYRQYYYAKLYVNGKPLPLGTNIKIGNNDYYTQLDGAVTISSEQTEGILNIDIYNSDKQCKVNLDNFSDKIGSENIPDVGVISCE